MSLEQSIESKITELAKEICEREGFILYDVEYLSTQKIVRIFVDKDGGVNLDDCAKVSSGVNFLLDVEDPIENKYNLEVSSPGLERHLTQKWHYENQLDKKIVVVIKARTETAKALGTKQLSGVLKKVEKEVFTIDSRKRGTVDCPFADVHKCNVVFDFDFDLSLRDKV